MKHIISYIAVLSIWLLASCTLEDFNPEYWAVEPSLNISKSGHIFNAYQGRDTILIESNYKEFIATSNHEDWCKVTTDIPNHQILIDVAENENVEQRSAIITVKVQRASKTLEKEIFIFQSGGEWELIEGLDLKIRWNYSVSDSQKRIIRDQLNQLVYVRGGVFSMGSQSDDEAKSNYNPYAQPENPVHKVELSDFYIGKYEVTQEQWIAVMGNNPSCCQGPNKPVENVSWEEIQLYIERLSQLTGLPIMLPTSAQWEYAARGGIKSKGYFYSGSNIYEDVAYYRYLLNEDGYVDNDSPLFTTSDVGTKLPNELGLYDMCGNVEEACSDWYGEIPDVEQKNPTGPNTGTHHVARGGSFYFTNYEKLCNVYHVLPFIYIKVDELYRSNFGGLRIVLKRW